MPSVKPRVAAKAQLADFTISHKLQFAAGWLPERKLWPTRAAYLADYVKVREEFMATWGDRPAHVPFAEQALRYGEAHGQVALASATNDEVRAAFRRTAAAPDAGSVP